MIVGILCSPNAIQLILIYHKRFVYNYLPPPTILIWLRILVPHLASVLCIFTIVYLFYWRLFYRRRWISSGDSLKLISFAAIWIILPPSLLFLMSSIFNVSVLSSRYAAASCAGFGLIVASLFSWISVSSIRNIGLLFFSFLAIGYLLFIPRNYESWREPTHYLQELRINDNRPLLLWSGLIESASRESIRTRASRSIFLHL